MADFKVPTGANPNQGHCGLVALACVLNMRVGDIEAYHLNFIKKRNGNWKGSTHCEEREALLKRMGLNSRSTLS